MGLDYNTTKFILFASRLDGVDFSETITLGRQSFGIHRKDLTYLFGKFNLPITKNALGQFYRSGDVKVGKVCYAEDFLTYLGAKKVDSLDASDYEGASIKHDMNDPIDVKYKRNYTMVIDGGALEHIFNLPIAIQNCVNLLKKGGHFISVAPANNFCGHGFYQFSPEIYFRVFGEKNGLRIRKILLSEVKSRKYWYEIPDPDVVGHRINLTNQVATYVMTLAEKISEDATIRTAPQQSDYEHISWKLADTERTNRRPYYGEIVKNLLPVSMMNFGVPAVSRLIGMVPRLRPNRNLKRLDI
jgi:SAM-dependent methyltransferase